jgi:exodeoxyribonuclease VII large subunit
MHDKARDLWSGRERLLEQRPDRRLAVTMARLAELTHRLGGAGVVAITGRRSRLDQLGGRLRALSPLAVLGRGYALALGPDQRVLRDAGQVEAGDDIKVRLAKGALSAKVLEVES